MEATGAAHVAGSETNNYSNKIKRVASSATTRTEARAPAVRFSASDRAGSPNVRIISAP
jgi:hypothetical protein